MRRSIMEVLEDQSPDGPSAEQRKKVVDAFQVFDHEQSNAVDVREIGNVIRSLGLCPSEGQLREIMKEVEDPTQDGTVTLERFQSVVFKIMSQKKYKSAPIDDLLAAFQALDVDGKGHLTEDDLRRFFRYRGEPMNDEEMDEFLNAALSNDTNTMNYASFAHLLTVGDEKYFTN